jgi:hypothetical protein
LKRDKTVSQIVEKYMRQYPNYDRDLIRKLIRIDKPGAFNLRTLDRHLKIAFEEKKKNQQPILLPLGTLSWGQPLFLKLSPKQQALYLEALRKQRIREVKT